MWAYKPYRNPDGTFDWASYNRDLEFIEYCEDNKGKNIEVIDDWTLEPIPKDEVFELEQRQKQSIFVPQYEHDDEGLPVIRVKSKRKYKPRKAITQSLRQAVHELYNHQCDMCGDDRANQLHHKDRDPSNNNIKNLQLLCYNCHLKIEGKKVYNE